jgi:acyl-CoA synthetase (AMP-forming)/AMP-acid ligase II
LALARQARIDHRNLSTLRAIMSAAAPLSADLAGDCSAKLGCIVKQGWGMTETSPAVTMTEPVPDRAKDGSVGHPVPNTEIKVIDLETGDELGFDQQGELLVRGPQVMKGYLNRPEATAQMIDGDGWLRTGDIGYADSEGFFFIVDRAKELIKYKGFQVAPAELEAILLTHPCVADAAVIPLPDEEAGEIPKAFIVLKAIATEQELMEYVSNQVARYKRIRVIEFIEQIPKSASGKILRRTLVARERAKLA